MLKLNFYLLFEPAYIHADRRAIAARYVFLVKMNSVSREGARGMDYLIF